MNYFFVKLKKLTTIFLFLKFKSKTTKLACLKIKKTVFSYSLLFFSFYFRDALFLGKRNAPIALLLAK